MNSSCPECNRALKNPRKCPCGWVLPEQKREEESPRGCMAHGCPMDGAIASSTSGSNGWLCAMHFRATPSNWQELTHRLRNNIQVVNLTREIRMAQNGHHFDYRGWAGSLHESNPDYLPNDDDRRRDGTLSMRRWQHRIEKMLFSSMMAGMDSERYNESVAKNAEEIMTKMDEFLKNRTNVYAE